MVEKFKDFTPQIDGTCFIAPGSAVIGDVVIGRNSSVWHNAVIRGYGKDSYRAEHQYPG